MRRYRHSRRPYYEWSQKLSEAYNKSNHNTETSSMEFWRWFDERCTRDQRNRVNYALNGELVIGVSHAIIQEQGEWNNAQAQQG